MNQQPLFGDETVGVPSSEERPAPLSVTAAPERLNFTHCIRNWCGHQHTVRLMNNVWRAEVGNTTMCFALTQFYGFGAESWLVPGAHELNVDSVKGAFAAVQLLGRAESETADGETLTKSESRHFARWCGEAQWPKQGPDADGRFSAVPTPIRSGAFAAFPGVLFDRNLLAQIIEILGAFYECDAVRYTVVQQERNGLLLMRGERANKAPGWRLFLSGISYNSKEPFDVFGGKGT